MPRTKVVKKKPVIQEKDENKEKLELLLQRIQSKKKETLLKMEEIRNGMLEMFQAEVTKQMCSIPYKYMNMTIKEIRESQEVAGSVTCISNEDIINITKSVKKERKGVKRSLSLVDDEGYLTAESVNSGGHKSRSKIKTHVQSMRRTRSLSKTNSLKTPAAYKTPSNQKTSDSYGMVTPKCKPNTPQLISRRPKTGELALSLQGSPLYTAGVVTETMANINIPLVDGRLLTLQPQRGLRISQIPQFDPSTLRQLEALRENLDKVCAASVLK